IRDATQHFLVMADMESHAPRMYPRGSRTNKELNAAERRILRIRNSTRDLVTILRQNPTDRDRRGAESAADHLIMMNCEALPELGGMARLRPAYCLKARFARAGRSVPSLKPLTNQHGPKTEATK